MGVKHSQLLSVIDPSRLIGEGARNAGLGAITAVWRLAIAPDLA